MPTSKGEAMHTMDRFSVFVPRLLPQDEPFVAALRSCPGCGQALAVRIIGKALTNHKRYPYGCSAPAVSASELPAAGWISFPPRKARRSVSKADAAEVLAVAGESGALDDLLSMLRGARRDGGRALAVCFFNEAGIERHGGMDPAEYRHDSIKSFSDRLAGVRAALERSRAAQPEFFATACASYPFDLIDKVRRALSFRTGFLAVFAPCPTGCLYDASLGLHAGRRAVQTGFFPLYQRERGATVMTVAPEPLLPVSAYMGMQQGYIVGPDEPERVQGLVDAELKRLRQECA